jgi:hypothetical protein
MTAWWFVGEGGCLPGLVFASAAKAALSQDFLIGTTEVVPLHPRRLKPRLSGCP